MTTGAIVVKLRNKSLGEEENSLQVRGAKSLYQVRRLTKGTWQVLHSRAVRIAENASARWPLPSQVHPDD